MATVDRASYRSERHERDYLERTIETVRNHQHAENCWPQWANIFADEIERLWQVEIERQAFERALEDERAASNRLSGAYRHVRDALEAMPCTNPRGQCDDLDEAGEIEDPEDWCPRCAALGNANDLLRVPFGERTS